MQSICDKHNKAMSLCSELSTELTDEEHREKVVEIFELVYSAKIDGVKMENSLCNKRNIIDSFQSENIGYSQGYKQGQIDALNGKYKYALIVKFVEGK